MPDDRQFTLRQIDQARGHLYGIADEIEALKVQIAGLPSRAYISRLALMATATVWALIAVALIASRHDRRQRPRHRVLSGNRRPATGGCEGVSVRRSAKRNPARRGALRNPCRPHRAAP